MAYFREVATELDEQMGWRLFFFFFDMNLTI